MSYEDLSQNEPEDGDIVGFGSSRAPRSPRRHWAGRLLIGAAVIVAVTVVVVRAQHSSPRAPPRPKPVVVTYAGHRLLGVTAKWDLIARSSSYLIVIQMATGKVTRTAVPPLESNNPEVTVLVEPHQVVVRSYDQVPGYVVPDGAPARLLTGTLAADSPGPLLPGPQQGQAWVLVSIPLPQSLALVGLDGKATSTRVRLPPNGALPGTAISDGRGYVLLLDEMSAYDLYDAGPTWYRHINAEILAVGSSRWLGVVCHKQCSNVVIDPATGSQRILPGPATQVAFSWPTLGVTSPDGSLAAVATYSDSNTMDLRLVSLQSGSSRTLPLPLVTAPGYQLMVWSPDSRWLFVVGRDGQLLAINAHTDQVTGLGIRLPAISQVAIRPAPGSPAR